MISIMLKEKKEVAKDTLLYVFERPKDFAFCAGQYVSMKVTKTSFHDEKGDFRSFSIASAPYREDVLEFSMRRSESAFKKNLESLEIGETVEITPATGKCILPDPDGKRRVVFLVGGVGITPTRSILLEAVHEARPERFFLFYSNRTPEDTPFLKEMETWNGVNRIDLTVVHTMTNMEQSVSSWEGERGFLDGEKMIKYTGNTLGDCDFYVVGVAPFVEAMQKMLADRGVTSDRIHSDNFGGTMKK